MNEITIEKHSFELAKKRLKNFSEKTKAEIELDNVQTDGGFFWLGDHKVTGVELNRRLETIRTHFITINTTNNKIIKEFREVYNALDALDKDYITSIIANVKAIEKTSNDVRMQQETLKRHNEDLVNQQSKLDMHQSEIEKNVDNIERIVTVLQVFKEKLESYGHLADVDKMWNNCMTVQNDIEVVSDCVTTLQDELRALATTVEEHRECIDVVFKNMVDAEKYAMENRNLITELKTFIAKMAVLNHLMEVDNMWEDAEKHTSQLIECGKKDEELATIIQNNKVEVDMKIADVIQNSNAAVESLTKKVKYAYWIAGGAVGIAIIELFLILMKVI